MFIKLRPLRTAILFCFIFSIFLPVRGYARESRLSGAVAFSYKSAEAQSFLAKPGLGYVQGYFRFGPEMADDVIMFVDQEMLEGVGQPLNFKGADWMAFAGIQRSGIVWIGGGESRGRSGTPSGSRDWKIFDIKQSLKPDTWYRMRVMADFKALKFVSFEIEGPGLFEKIDISDVLLDYPNYMPFDGPSMIYIVGAMRGKSMMKEKGIPVAYFDDVEGGIISPSGARQSIFQDGFENTAEVGAQPVTLPVIKLENYDKATWYKEQEQAIFKTEEVPFARSGKKVGIADASLD